MPEVNYGKKTGLLREKCTPKYTRDIIEERKLRIAHVFVILQYELNRRGWDRHTSEVRASDACSLKSLVDFGCLVKLKANDDFPTQREMVYEFMNIAAHDVSHRKTWDFTSWEQADRAPEKIDAVVANAFQRCTRSL